jgi:Salmonella virulence plasmid 65kDa B protein
MPRRSLPSSAHPLRGAVVPLLLFVACLLAPVSGGQPPPALLACPAYGSAALPAPLDVSPTPSAGSLPGSFSVSASGQANYRMPLVVPPGRLGMEPSLAVGYDSSAGEGMLGVGFSLQGLSSITRCAANLAQDNYIAPVEYDDTDHFCLDGGAHPREHPRRGHHAGAMRRGSR